MLVPLAKRLISVGVAVLVAGVTGCARPGPAPTPVSVATLMQPTGEELQEEYRIGIGDELHVRFTYQPEMNEEVPVRTDGRITLATTGEILAAGKTPKELEDIIVAESSDRLRDPEVRVIVTKMGEKRVYVGGEVGRPGYVTLQPGMTPLQAVLHAGGFRRTAKMDSVLLLSPSRSGAMSAARMNMAQVVEDGVPERVRLASGDVVFVPATWISDMNDVVNLYVRGLIPVLPRVGAGYSLNNN
jgi:protein involved in polysaccharide export with SLBB domain